MSRLRVFSIVLSGLVLTGAGTAGCVNPLTALPKLFEARRLTSELQVWFTRAPDASNRAVMADPASASIAAKDEATKARQVVDHDLDTLQPLLSDLATRQAPGSRGVGTRATRNTATWTTRFFRSPSRTRT